MKGLIVATAKKTTVTKKKEKTIMEKIKNEPLLLIGLVSAVLMLAVNFGVEINDGQQDAIINTVIAIIAVLVGRSQVSPVSSLPTPKTAKKK